MRKDKKRMTMKKNKIAMRKKRKKRMNRMKERRMMKTMKTMKMILANEATILTNERLK
jgi:hypothetical protein